MALAEEKKYTANEFFELIPETNQHYELYDGKLTALAAPNAKHQDIVGGLYSEIRSFIRQRKGSCRTFSSPFDVKLDEHNVIQPDVMVICDKNKLDDKRCYGSPEFVCEVVSADRNTDYVKKLSLYQQFGAREYWIIDPEKEKVLVYIFENKEITSVDFYTFENEIPVDIFCGDLEIKINDLI